VTGATNRTKVVEISPAGAEATAALDALLAAG